MMMRMMREMPAVLMCGLGLGLAAPAPAGDLPAPDEIFAKQTEAMGGDALKGVKNAAMEFTFSMPDMGLDTTGKAFLEAPDKSYMMISLAAVGSPDFEDGSNGDVAWQNNPQMGMRLKKGLEATMARQRARLDPFADWRDSWAKAETVGEETLGGKACYKVVLTHPDGETLTAYFDKESGLVQQFEVPLPQMGATVTIQPSDYREIDGVTLAHHIEQEGPMTSTIEYTRVRFNVDDIPEDAFEVPAAIEKMVAK
jgi:hypothetical protein